MTVPPGQGESGPRAPEAAPSARGDQPHEDERSAARIAGEDSDLERARDAARSAPEQDQGLDKARDAARRADPTGGVDCLSSREARGAILAKRAVTLSQALKAARDAWDGEVIDYRLCTFDGALAYELTLLNTQGRVARVRVNASNGKLVRVR